MLKKIKQLDQETAEIFNDKRQTDTNTCRSLSIKVKLISMIDMDGQTDRVSSIKRGE